MNMYREFEAAPAITLSSGCQARCSSLDWKSAVTASMPPGSWDGGRLLLSEREMPNL